MKREPTVDRDAAPTPEAAVWMLYAGMVQGMRWRMHLASAPRPASLPTISRARSVSVR
jgi:hypothetical protein